jgi:hypothetical protein
VSILRRSAAGKINAGGWSVLADTVVGRVHDGAGISELTIPALASVPRRVPWRVTDSTTADRPNDLRATRQ